MSDDATPERAARSADAPRRVALVSLGCAKNEVDAETLLGALLSAGWDLAVEAADADVVVVNTCAFIEPAREEARAHLDEMLALKDDHPDLQVVVTGCMAARYGERLLEEFPALDGVFGFGAYADPAAAFEAIRQAGTDRVCGVGQPTPLAGGPRLLFSGGAYAYLRLAEGCDNRCSYCAVPLIRGGLRSRPEADILAEAEELSESGVGELALVAQDTAAYGMDRGGVPQLGALLQKLLALPGAPWIRLLYAHPAHLRQQEEVIDLLAGEPRLLGYLDLPIQHIDDRILSAMGRHISEREVLDLLDRLRQRIPDLVLRTSIITGFPGEDEASFERLAAFVDEGRFQHLGVFAYCPEEDTVARGLPDRPPAEVARARAERIMELQQRHAFAWLDSRVGAREEVLVDMPLGGGEALGRTRGEAPEGVDGRIRMRGGDFSPGERIPACLVSRDGYDLIANAE
ncbi:MAG: 30S ribosomal protein S12 methylthiotransferase RimO [Planctomycetota bacterium]